MLAREFFSEIERCYESGCSSVKINAQGTMASIRYKDEDKLLNAADDVDEVYVNEVLPAKMKWNLESIRRFRFLREILTMFRTVLAVMGKEYQ